LFKSLCVHYPAGAGKTSGWPADAVKKVWVRERVIEEDSPAPYLRFVPPFIKGQRMIFR
jgi:hypothetical protein